MTKNKLVAFVQKVSNSRSILLGVLAAIIGVLTGAGVWLFKYLFNLLKQFYFTTFPGWFPHQKFWLVALVPVVGGILVGLMIKYLGSKEKVAGTAGIIQSVEIAGGRLRYQHLPVKTLEAIVSIGTGASVGPEDPSVQIGANLGSFLGQTLRLRENETAMLVGAGAAAAIAAAFNAPIAGVFFALEIIIGDLTGSSLGLILISAVLSSVFTQAVSGTSPAFQVHTYSMSSSWEIGLYIGLGLLAGPISALYVRLLYWAQDLFGQWKFPGWAKTGVAGLIVGCTGIFLPQVFGVGYDTITNILSQSQMTFWLLIALMVGKLIMTPVSIGGGFTGGVFAPSLFIGAAMGGAYGVAMAALFPSLGIAPSAYALVGMAAVLAGAVHAPLTAAILLFEMTSDYRIILPLLLAVAISLIISQKIQPRSVYSLGLARKGFFLSRAKQIDVLETVFVKETMHHSVQTLSVDDDVSLAKEYLFHSHARGLPVLDKDGELCGILTMGDVEAIPEGKKMTIANLCRQHPSVTYPQDTLASALKKMSVLEVGQLPVVLPEDPRHVVGMLYREDVIHAYAVATKRRQDMRYSEQQSRLDAVTPEQVEINEVTVEKGSLVDGKLLREIEFPADCLVASVRHNNRVIIPRGDTVIEHGDTLVLVAQGQAVTLVERMCMAEPKQAQLV